MTAPTNDVDLPDTPADVDPSDPPASVDPPAPPVETLPTEPPAEVETPDTPAGDVPPAPPAMDSSNTNRVAAYHDPQLTNFGVEISCAQCHGQDGSGGQDTAGHPVGGLRGLSAEVLAAHAQQDADHPAPTGRADIKFPNLAPADFDAIAAFLSQ